jgi:hypothetical protein
MSQTKAIHLHNFRKLVLQQAGEPGWQEIAKRLSSEDRQLLNQPALASQWIDYAFWWRLLVAADQALGQGDYQWIHTMGGFDAQENLQGIYKPFLQLMSVKAVVKSSNLIWRRYYDSGEMRVIRLEDQEAEIHLHDFPGLQVHHEVEIIGWMEGALKLVRATRAKVSHDLCLAKGDPYCRFLIRWQG